MYLDILSTEKKLLLHLHCHSGYLKTM